MTHLFKEHTDSRLSFLIRLLEKIFRGSNAPEAAVVNNTEKKGNRMYLSKRLSVRTLHRLNLDCNL